MELALPGMIGFLCCLCIGFLLVWPVREAYNDRDFKTEISRAEFETMCADLFDRVLTPVKKALDQATRLAAPKDIVDIVVSKPITIRVKPAE